MDFIRYLEEKKLISLLKMDIEGSEIDFKGMINLNLLKKFRIYL